MNPASGRGLWTLVTILLTYVDLRLWDLDLNISFSSIFLLVVSGAISSALLSSGYFLASAGSIVLTAAAWYYLERREQKSEAILHDRPIY